VTSGHVRTHGQSALPAEKGRMPAHLVAQLFFTLLRRDPEWVGLEDNYRRS